jgi:hypothetical protein
VKQAHRHHVVIPELDADGVLHWTAAPPALTFLKRSRAGDEAMIDLLTLIAVDGIIQKERKVRDQPEVVAEAVGLDLGERAPGSMLPFAAEAIAIGVSAIGRVDGAEAIDQPAVDRALWRGFGRIPPAVVAHERERQPVHVVALAVTQHAVELSIGVRNAPWS